MHFVVTHFYVHESKVLNTSKTNFCLNPFSNVKAIRLLSCSSKLKFASVFWFSIQFKRIGRITIPNAFCREIM